MLPGGSIRGRLPATDDGIAVVAERAREALSEVERRKVRSDSQQRPEMPVEGHGVHADEAARVEVVLRVSVAASVNADERETVRRGVRDRGALDEKLTTKCPLEHGDRGIVPGQLKRYGQAPAADERLQALQRGGSNVVAELCSLPLTR
jgi:hypothetical protein